MKPRAEGDEWPPRLRHFDPAEWPPEPGEVAADGPPWSAGSTVLAAHARWCAARLAALPEGTLEHGAERLRGLRENVRMIRGNPTKKGDR